GARGGGCWGMRCRERAKHSRPVTYVQDAADRGARIAVKADVRRVLVQGRMAVGVTARAGGHTLTVRAQVVVVAGGAIHSPALLLRSGVALPALGRFLALHPATGVFGRMDEPVRPWTGAVQAHYSDPF